MKRILITGATGFIGYELVKALSSKEEIIVLAREDSNVSALRRFKVKVVYGDLLDQDSLKNIFEKVGKIDLLYHLACVIGDNDESDKDIWNSNVSGTRKLLEEAHNHGVKRVVYFSSIAVYGYTTKIVNEKSPYSAKTTKYGRAKRFAEKIVWDFSRRGLKATVIQPVFVYGTKSKGALITLFKAVKNKKFFFVGSGENKIHLVHVNNLVDAAILASGKKAIGKKYLVGDEDLMSLRELVTEAAKIMKVDPPKRRVPKFAVQSAAIPKNMVALIKRKKIPITQSKIDFMTKNMAGSIKRIKKELGYKPKISTKEGLRKVIPELIKKGKI
ncbi:MAG: SDR family NAD(P)-dependent oxidoreductase [bacterium]|nr:SDR family NAD(P)-dependent oxidoreductase [bacterium]